MKKILHISKYYPPYCGGIEDVVYSFVNYLRDRYIQKVICFNHERGTTYSIENGVDVLRVGTMGELASQPVSLHYFHCLKQQLSEFQPDIIHIHLPNPLICAYVLALDLKGIKLVIHWHADILGKQTIYKLIQPVERRILEKADIIIATSREYAEQSIPLRPFLNKVSIIPNTVNEEKLSLSEQDISIVHSIHERYGKKIVLYIGRHVEYKGIKYLIDSVPMLPSDTSVLIAGTGQQTTYLKTLAEQYDNVHFLGRIPNDELKHYLYAADVFAFPSIDRREAFGVALAEALYCGLPVVAFDIKGSGTTWVNRNGQTGLVVKEQTAQSFAAALNTLLKDEEMRKRLSSGATTWVKEHFLNNQIEHLTDIYDKC